MADGLSSAADAEANELSRDEYSAMLAEGTGLSEDAAAQPEGPGKILHGKVTATLSGNEPCSQDCVAHNRPCGYSTTGSTE